MSGRPVRRGRFAAAFAFPFVFSVAAMAAGDPSLDPPNLRFDAGYSSRLRWDPPAGAATIFGLYRGTIGPTGFRAYDHACELTEPGYRTTRDERVPPPGEAFYYIVTGFVVDPTGRFTVGQLGTDSRGVARPDSTTITCGPRVHVDPQAPSSGDGSDWAHAYRTLAEALRHPAGSDRGLEVWAKGTLAEGTVRFDGAAHPAVSILGGFGGTELRPWQRQPAVTPTRNIDISVPFSARSVRLDGLESSRVGHEGLMGGAVVVRNVRNAAVTIDSEAAGHDDGTLIVEDCTFDGGNVSVTHVTGTLRGSIRRNLMDGAASTKIAILVETGDLQRADFLVDIHANRFGGGVTAISAECVSGDAGGDASMYSNVTSNLFTGQSDDAITLRAWAWVSWWGAVDCSAGIVGNTIANPGGSAVSTAAFSTELSFAYATAALWDNIITGCGGPALAEGSEYPGGSSDLIAVGNDLYDDVLFVDEAMTELLSPDEVNALPGCRDNYALDPLFAGAATGDYRLLAGSPSLDRGHRDRPPGPTTDAGGLPRFADADGDGVAEPDTGAFEYHPE